MRELTHQEVDELSGGNPLVMVPISGVIGGTIGGIDYALNSAEFTALGLTTSVAQAALSSMLITGGTFLSTIPGGAAAGVPAIALSGIIQITDPLKSLQ